jgi:hypothetical protein
LLFVAKDLRVATHLAVKIAEFIAVTIAEFIAVTIAEFIAVTIAEFIAGVSPYLQATHFDTQRPEKRAMV